MVKERLGCSASNGPCRELSRVLLRLLSRKEYVRRYLTIDLFAFLSNLQSKLSLLKVSVTTFLLLFKSRPQNWSLVLLGALQNFQQVTPVYFIWASNPPTPPPPSPRSKFGPWVVESWKVHLPFLWLCSLTVWLWHPVSQTLLEFIKYYFATLFFRVNCGEFSRLEMCIIFRLGISKAAFRRRQGSEININSFFIIISANKIRRENNSISFRAVLLFAFQFRADLVISRISTLNVY